jgi:phage-related protein
MTKEIRWCGSAYKDFCAMPDGARRQFNTKFRYLAENVIVSGLAAWSGIGPGGFELKSGGFRLVATREFEDAIYGIHAFKKDASRGKKTRPHHINVVSERYKALCQAYSAKSRKQ